MLRFVVFSGWLLGKALIGKCFYSWEDLQKHLLEAFLSCNLLGTRIEGAPPTLGLRTLVIANHQHLLDWLFIKMILSCQKNVVFIFRDDVFVPWPLNRILKASHISISCRNTVQDRIAIQKALRNLPINVSVVLFPEGNLFRCLHHPKAGALHELVLSGAFDKIIDVTMAYAKNVTYRDGLLPLFLDNYPRTCRFSTKDLTARFLSTDTYTDTKTKLTDYWFLEKKATRMVISDFTEEEDEVSQLYTIVALSVLCFSIWAMFIVR